MKIRFGTQEKLPIHVIGKTDLRRWPVPLKDAWSIFQDTLAEAQESTGLITHAFVMMGNHYHWLCTFDHEQDPGYFDWLHECLNMQFLKYADPDCGWLGVMQPQARIVEIQNFPAYKATYKYVYTNPVRAGLVERAEEYPASTLPYVLGEPGLEFHCQDNMNLITDAIRTLTWLNSTDDENPLFDLRGFYQFLDGASGDWPSNIGINPC